MIKNALLFVLFLILGIGSLNAQISGIITDTNKEALSFASIYVQNTSRGTSSNVEGNYFLDLSPGTYRLVFQYIGYRQKIVEVRVGQEPIQLDVELEEETVTLSEVVVKANAEDPAYAIIRKAIQKRPYYKNLVAGYSCDVYIKGNQKLLDAPDKVFGQEIGDMGGSLDSNRQGIVYLSESEARLHYQRPNQKKEVMISSKVSGNDNGFSFNRATLMDFSFYENNMEIERQILSPIADNALSYYRYRLEGSFYDEEGRLINKIEVIPKRKEDPVFSGQIYIVEDLWNIYGTELSLTGASIKQPVVDSILIKQVHVPVRGPDTWMLFSQSIQFQFGLLGFKVDGDFTGMFTNYELDPSFPEGFFSNEVFKVEDESNTKDLIYWDSIRPIPLTLEENDDYIKKDSLQEIWESKSYLDSMDRKRNKLKFWDLLFGYSYANSYKKKYFSFGSPLTRIQFNTVQGFYGEANISYRREFDDYNIRWYNIAPKIQYGLGDKEWRISGKSWMQFNRTHFSGLGLSGGRAAMQFNEEDPISPTLNSLYSLLAKKNYLKLYDKYFVRLDAQHELFNGFLIRANMQYAQRRNLINQAFNSIYKGDRDYMPNHPYYILNEPPSFTEFDVFLVDVNMRFRIQQKYLTYPGRKIIMGSKYPDLWLRIRSAIPLSDNFVDYLRLAVRVEDQWTFGLAGSSNIAIEGGLFAYNNRSTFIDYKHFNGNRLFIANPFRYNNSFLRLPYYDYSTDRPYVEGHWHHNFEGFLLDKMPLLRKLNLKMVLGASFLYTENKKDYWELSAGFDNIGFGAFRLFRVDVVSSFAQGKYLDTGVVIGIRI